jgi:hypothetical protein
MVGKGGERKILTINIFKFWPEYDCQFSGNF